MTHEPRGWKYTPKVTWGHPLLWKSLHLLFLLLHLQGRGDIRERCQNSLGSEPCDQKLASAGSTPPVLGVSGGSRPGVWVLDVTPVRTGLVCIYNYFPFMILALFSMVLEFSDGMSVEPNLHCSVLHNWWPTAFISKWRATVADPGGLEDWVFIPLLNLLQ